MGKCFNMSMISQIGSRGQAKLHCKEAIGSIKGIETLFYSIKHIFTV